MIAALKTFLSVLMSVLCFCTSLIFGDFSAGYEPLKGDCKMQFAVISDIHMTDETARRDILELGLYDMENAGNKLDALILSGDMTDHARSEEYSLLAEAFSKYNPAKNILMAIGNHDTWNNETDNDNRFPESERLFFEYSKKISGRELNKVYYSTVINGYKFIVMSSEGDNTAALITDEQLAWLDCELKNATEEGMPAFVISHWPLDNTHGLPGSWGEDAEDGTFKDNRSDDVKAILDKYKNVFLISGHIHNGLANEVEIKDYKFSTVESYDTICSVNLPSYMYVGSRGTVANGTGLVFEVYDDEVIIRARSFSAGVWYTNYVYNIELK